MGSDKQMQKAGDGSQQVQAGTIIINNNNGIEERRAREIFMEMFNVVRKDLTDEALAIATHRVIEFENDLIPRMQEIDGAMNAFADPSFQFLLTSAHKTAAGTDRTADYALLSELLIHRIQRGANRNTLTGISRAVEIVDEISNEALLGLTVAFAVERYSPVSGMTLVGLDVLDNLFEKLCYDALPQGNEWIDHLDILDAVRMSNLGSLKKLEEYYYEQMHGYCVLGIKRDSENYIKANEMLMKFALPKDTLITNDFNDEYVRIPVVNEQSIDNLLLNQSLNVNENIVSFQMALSDEQKHVVHQIYNMYEDDKSLEENIKQKFIEEIAKRPNLGKVREWWNQIPVLFKITAVGRVLAHSNAKRCDRSLPDLN